ncbi:MAG: hypothetical protein U0Q16_19855 [Bryobacteraceae bacterium]
MPYRYELKIRCVEQPSDVVIAKPRAAANDLPKAAQAGGSLKDSDGVVVILPTFQYDDLPSLYQ